MDFSVDITTQMSFGEVAKRAFGRCDLRERQLDGPLLRDRHGPHIRSEGDRAQQTGTDKIADTVCWASPVLRTIAHPEDASVGVCQFGLWSTSFQLTGRSSA